MRRGSIVQLVILGMLFAAGAAAVALFIPWLPRPASEQADRIDFVFWFVTAICIAIFALVAAVITYSLLHFRAEPDDDSDGPPTHGHTGLEIWWTAVPAVLVTAISIVSAIVLAKNEHLPHVGNANATANAATAAEATKGDPLKPLVVKVTGQQFAWLFQYPGFGKATSSTLRLPVDVPVQLRLGSLDVIHSFWVPEFGQKQDAVPGMITKLVITPNRLGTFPVICTELCGLGHALMRAQATVMTRGKFLAWAKAQGSEANPGNGAPGGTSGKKVFIANGCNGCHTFKPANAAGAVGPDLDKLEELARTAGKPLDEFIRQSIVDPGAYIESGFPNAMPGTYSTLPPEQIDALVKFLSGGGS